MILTPETGLRVTDGRSQPKLFCLHGHFNSARVEGSYFQEHVDVVEFSLIYRKRGQVNWCVSGWNVLHNSAELRTNIEVRGK